MIESQLEKNEFSVRARVLSFEDRFAILRLDLPFSTDDFVDTRWPIKQLPDQISLGDEVRLDLSTSRSREDDRDLIAQKVLEEIIN